MKLKIINSGSSGNAYILETESEALLIECGVPFKDIKKALDFDLNKVVGCLVTHEHKDHCRSVNEVMSYGIKTFATASTHLSMATNENYFSQILKMIDSNFGPYLIGNFRIIAFKVQHDAADPIGFLIYHPECGTVLFATDTYFLKQTFRGLNNIIIEANYCEEILEQKNKLGIGNQYVSDRVVRSHMSIQQCINTLKSNDLSAVNNIVLIHLSDSNSNEKRFKQMVEDATGKTVTVASKGMELEFNKTPF